MRIAEINDIASVASELTAGLRERGHEVTLFQPRLVGGRLHWAVKPVVGPARAAEWAQLIHAIRSGRFDLVHIHYAYLGMVGVLGKFPFILHCHGSDIREVTPFTRPLTDQALKHAGHVFYATPDLAEFVLERRPDAEFMPNPVDARQFRPLRPARESKRVFVACSLDDIKGAGRILDACRRLATIRPDIRVSAIEGGEHTGAFAALPNVTLLPRHARSRRPEIVADHGVVIGQVLLGVVGMAELEAMACARPVISWFTYDRAYQERPALVRAVDGFDIAAAAARLVDDAGLRERLGDEGRAWVERYHSLERAAECVEQAATRVLAGLQTSPSR